MNLFELFVKIGAKDEASGTISKITQGLGKGLKTAAKIGTAAVGAAAAGITALTTAAVNNYAEYEQLAGGAELMFGKAYETVAKNAQDAYKTVQMSQNEYLQQVNGFATGLKTALGGNEQAAAELAHNIVKAEADIIAATGNTAENVQNAFNGIMKSNFTMLDNLQIGITPTKEGFQEVIDKVNEWNEANGRATEYQMGNLADMQSALVDYIDMVGMSGYAQMEASETITGSLSSMKAAWKNLVTGFANDAADLDKLIGTLTDSIVGYTDESGKYVKGVLDNLLPAVEKSLGGIAKLIEGAAPKIIEILPGLAERIVPSVISTATGMINAVVEVIPDLIKTVVDAIVENAPMLIDSAIVLIGELSNGILYQLPQIVQLGFDLIVSLANGIAESLPELIPTIVDVVLKIVETLIDNVDMLVDASIAIVTGLVDGLVEALPKIANVSKGIIETLAKGIVENTPQLLSNGVKMLADFSANLRENLGTIVDAGIDTLLKFVDGIVEAMPDLIAYVPEIVSNIANIINDNAPKLVLAAAQIIWKLVVGLIDNIPVIIQNLPKIISAIVDTILAFNWVNLGSSIIKGLGNGLKSMVSFVKNIGNQIVNAIKGGISNLPSQMINIGKNIVSGLWNGIKSTISWLGSKIKGFAGGIVSAAKNALGIRSPSRVFRDQIGKQMAAGIGVGWEDEFDKVKSDIEGSLSFDDASVGINASIRKVGEENLGHTYGSTTIGNVTINIDGAKYSDENSLAEAMAEALQNMTDRRSAVYA